VRDRIAYSVNRSDVAEVAAHLLRVDAAFTPALSGRIDVPAYAQKLHEHAVRFEAWLGDELVGLVASYCNRPDEGKAFVTSVSVLPKCQRLGIADKLLRQCIEHATRLGFGQLGLEVDQRSLPAIALYHKLGFNTLCSHGSRLSMSMTLERKAR
jgi:ribosomal protein S18 acetylase RimI-like enzyme